MTVTADITNTIAHLDGLITDMDSASGKKADWVCMAIRDMIRTLYRIQAEC